MDFVFAAIMYVSIAILLWLWCDENLHFLTGGKRSIELLSALFWPLTVLSLLYVLIVHLIVALRDFTYKTWHGLK